MANENYYVDNDLDITIECQRSGDTLDLSDYSELRIYYKKPVSESVDYWDASLSGTHQLTYSATHTTDSDGIHTFDIDEAGIWKLYAYVIFNPGAIYKGDTVELEIKKTWQIQ